MFLYILCKKSGDNLCTCAGVEFPVFIDDNVAFHNLTFSNAEVGRLKTNNCNNTDNTYSIFEQIDKVTLQCGTTLGAANFNAVGQSWSWNG